MEEPKVEANLEAEDGDGAEVLIILFIVVGSQFLLFWWKKNYYASFRNVTLFGLWTMPFLISLSVGFWRMIVIWSFWTLTTAYIIKQARAQPLQPRTPRFVYGWFYRSYQVCSNAAIVGYVMLMVDWFIIPVETPSGHYLAQYGLLLAFYGFYFGVLGRDCSEMCADWMASMMGFTGKKDEIPSKHIHPNLCGICGGRLKTNEVLTESEVDEDETKDKTVSLTCEHLYLDFNSDCKSFLILLMLFVGFIPGVFVVGPL